MHTHTYSSLSHTHTTHIYTHAYTRIHTHTHAYTRIHTHTHMHMHMHIHMHMHMHMIYNKTRTRPQDDIIRSVWGVDQFKSRTQTVEIGAHRSSLPLSGMKNAVPTLLFSALLYSTALNPPYPALLCSTPLH